MRRTSPDTRFLFAIAVALLASTSMPAADPSTPPRIDYGADGDALHLLKQQGLQPRYTQIWVGAWLQRDGWNAVDDLLRRATENETTPVIQFYYWGDDLTEECFRLGCDVAGGIRKDHAGWDQVAHDLIQHLNQALAGAPAVIVVETEFNKDLRHDEDLDAALESKILRFQQAYPPATVVLGFGSWDHASWHVFDRAAAASDEIGLQLMRGHGRDSLDDIRNAPDSLLQHARAAQRLFEKPVFVSDIAISSYGGADYESAQSDAVRRLFELEPQLQRAGVHAIVFRSVLDNPRADTNGYYGEGERHFGLVWTHNHTAKPAFETLLKGVQGEILPADAPSPEARPARRGLLDWLPFLGTEAQPEPEPSQNDFLDAWLTGLFHPPAGT